MSVFAMNSKTKTCRSSQRWNGFKGLATGLYGSISDVALRFTARLRETEAAELLEFALSLPLILVMVVGLLDFAHAYNLKQKLANAAREGARLQSSVSSIDRTAATPATVQDTYNDVVTYLKNAGVDTSFIGTTMTYVPCPGSCTATYYTTRNNVNYGLEIERDVIIPSGGVNIEATRVTLYYPYDWTYGFNNVIKLLVPSATFADPIRIVTDATMPNST